MSRSIVRISILIILFLNVGVRCLFADEPKRSNGLSVHMLPKRVAEIRKEKPGFTITEQGGKRPPKATPTFESAQELVEYIKTLPPEIQENGIWVVTTNPASYSDAETKNLEKLKEICAKEKLKLFTCRGSDLPNGWKSYN